MTGAPKRLVLDTNAVLDWLIFADPCFARLEGELEAGRVQVIGHPSTQDELRRVLDYPALRLEQAQQMQALARYRAQCVQPELPIQFSCEHLFLPDGFPKCRDADDQIFLALAYHTGAVLLSRDKAVLKLAKRARRFGVTVISPLQLAQWLGADYSS